MTTGRMKTLAAMALSAVSLLAASGAQATLSYRLNNQAVYDDVAQLTWLRDANYAQTSGYDGDGQMNWSTAMAWADGLSIGGVDDWRLPGGQMVTYGYNQTTSEMGNMFYNVLGGTDGSSITITHSNATNYDLFQNIQSSLYWSGVESELLLAWGFGFANGFQSAGGFKSNNLFAWAVRSGDVGGNPVPAPGTLALLGAGLLGWAGVKRSRHRVGAVIG